MRRLLAGALCLVICLGLFGANALAAVVLSVGSRGENVTKVQKRLIQYDYLDGTADGIYGEETAAAVRLFQRRNGLSVDGKVGPATAAALGVTLSASGSASASSSTAIISSDHRLLSKLVYAEARGEPYKGMVAVAAVVLNFWCDLSKRRVFLRVQWLYQQYAQQSVHPRGARCAQRLGSHGRLPVLLQS